MLKQFKEEKKSLLNQYDFLLNKELVPVEDIKKEDVLNYKKELENERFLVSFCGQIKAGKSTLINALIFGDEILPSADMPHTAKITILRYSEKPFFEVEFYNTEEWEKLKNQIDEETKEKYYDKYLKDAVNRSAREGLVIDSVITNNGKIEKFDDYSKLNEFVGANGKYTPFVKEVTLYYPSELLKDIDIVDTPGINDPNKLRSEITEKWIHNSDAVVYVVYAGQAFNSEDIKFIDQFLLHVDRNLLIYAVNKIDTVESLAGLQSWIEDVRHNHDLNLRNIMSSDSTIVKISALGALINKMHEEGKQLPEDLLFYAQQLDEKGFIENNKTEDLLKAIEEKIIKNKAENILKSHKQKIESIFDRNLRILDMEITIREENLKNLSLTAQELEKKRKKLLDEQNKIKSYIHEFRDEFEKNFTKLKYEIESIFIEIKNELIEKIVSAINRTGKISVLIHEVSWLIKNQLENSFHKNKINFENAFGKFNDEIKELQETINMRLGKKGVINQRMLDLILMKNMDKIMNNIRLEMKKTFSDEVIKQIIKDVTFFWQRWFNTQTGLEKAKSALKNKVEESLNFDSHIDLFSQRSELAINEQVEAFQKDLFKEIDRVLKEIDKIKIQEENKKEHIEKVKKEIEELEKRKKEIELLKKEITQ